MMSENTKTAALLVGGAIIAITIPTVGHYLETQKQAELELKKTELEAGYPTEYWVAKQAESDAEAKIQQARIESEERLKIDARDREDARHTAEQEFEKNAPAEYWEQKRIEAEEKTKRELNKQRYDAERRLAEQHSEAIRQGIKATERAFNREFGNTITPFDLI